MIKTQPSNAGAQVQSLGKGTKVPCTMWHADKFFFNYCTDCVLYSEKDEIIGDVTELKSHMMWLEISMSHHDYGKLSTRGNRA